VTLMSRDGESVKRLTMAQDPSRGKQRAWKNDDGATSERGATFLYSGKRARPYRCVGCSALVF
jgi:hypothetical protein